ncbi:MAG: hypothetical protein FIA82_02220 [Melioribacter sp.]|nr:hypothetical protein [Melioribacter sp.]
MAPKYFFEIKGGIPAEVKAKIFTKTKLVLLSDYDGTLTPIRKNPSMAILSSEVKPDINWDKGKAVLKILKKINARATKKA